MQLDVLLAFSTATAALAISPGPDNIYVLMQSVVHGKRFGLATVAGLMTGCLVHTTLLAFGVSALLRRHEGFFFVITLFGATYLLYLAVNVYRENRGIDMAGDALPKKTLVQLFKQGFVMNVLNPKVTIFFLAFFPGFLFSDTLGTVAQFYILGFLFIAVSSVVFGGIALLSGGVSRWLSGNSKAAFFLKWMQIVVFVGIALYLLSSNNLW
ncbi:LysE family translocator [Maribacter sp. 2307ULW6-5]|uniref:LysE family translocator n=1 Tax=Maribacter sp. 2307ULW6-5 TaxID=3386275 RepID=UPI0039BCA1ED